MIPPIDVPLVYQTQVEFVNQRGRLQREADSLAAKLAGGDAAQLRVDEWQQLIESIRVTTPPFSQKCCHVRPGCHQVVER